MCEYIVERTAANLPQSAQSALFTVSGGRVLLLRLVPEVATAIQNQSNTATVYANPSVGSDVSLMSPGDIGNQAAGILWGNAGTTGYSVVSFPSVPFVVPTGTIDLSCSASSTGQIKWVLVYQPLDPGAKVEAA